MKITIIGAGYVGVVTGTCLAEFGHIVTCIDTDKSKVEELSLGKSPIYEPGLEDLLISNIRKERLFFTSEWSKKLADVDVIFITVGTPSSRRGSGYADMSYVYEAAKNLANHLTNYTVVVNKSTVPVGSARQVDRIIRETNPKAIFDIASNPEFLREGAAIHDFMHPDRIVLGVESPKALEILQRLYHPLYLIETPCVVTNLETAELIKYASNAFLATKISFINEMANICETIGANVQDLAHGMGLDGRIGRTFLHAGPGYGGSCFPKDTTALIRMAQEHGAPTRIVETVVEVNNAQKARMVRKIQETLGSPIAGKTLAILGITFKPETDDIRESPALTILPALIEKGVRIKAHDPEGMSAGKSSLPEVEYCSDAYEACKDADAVCLITEWNSYRALDLSRLKTLLKKPVFIDLRNVYQPSTMKEAGFYYVSIGRPTING